MIPCTQQLLLVYEFGFDQLHEGQDSSEVYLLLPQPFRFVADLDVEEARVEAALGQVYLEELARVAFELIVDESVWTDLQL